MMQQREYDSQEKREREEEQRTYESILATQIKARAEVVVGSGKMTEAEKRFNQRDLSVPPGPDLAAVELREGRRDNGDGARNKQHPVGGVEADLSLGEGNRIADEGSDCKFQLGRAARLQESAAGTQCGRSAYFHLRSMIRGIDARMGVKYNPIINPIPNYVQNAYVLKQRRGMLNNSASPGPAGRLGYY